MNRIPAIPPNIPARIPVALQGRYRAEWNNIPPHPTPLPQGEREAYGHLPMSTGIARHLRKRMTTQERFLWRKLRSRYFHDYKFRRQVPIDRFIVDFCCYESKLIVELDGGGHGRTLLQDQHRDGVLRSLGFTVLRFWNHQLHEDAASVFDAILRELAAEVPSPSMGEG